VPLVRATRPVDIGDHYGTKISSTVKRKAGSSLADSVRSVCGTGDVCYVSDRSVWLILFALGCFHGINPGMGWLFAVALGLQERSTRAVLSAIGALTIGHLVSIAVVVALTLYASLTFPHALVHRSAAAILFAFGAYRLIRARHPRWVGMRVGFGGLTLWGFIMASAHGAGLMLAPFVVAIPAAGGDPMNMPMPTHDATHSAVIGLGMVAVHTLGYLLVTTAVAVLVYRKLGLGFLRAAWFNIDAIWAIALCVTGIVALVT
jgi:hypothetical protein